jgi:hypothetical protein
MEEAGKVPVVLADVLSVTKTDPLRRKRRRSACASS